MSAGVCYIVYGEQAQTVAQRSIKTLVEYGGVHARAITVIGDPMANVNNIPFSSDALGRWAKVNLDILSPYDQTVYIDADTLIRLNIQPIFDMLTDGFDMVIVPSTNQTEDDLLWHIGKDEREATYDMLGYQPLQLQGGVFAFRRSPAIDRLFAYWRLEWKRWRDQDQAALLRALARQPVKLWLAGRPFNGGAVIAHLFGKARATV